jgi:acyl carrier protein
VLSETSAGTESIESLLNSYISREFVTRPELLPLKNDSQLLESGILDSLSLLKLVLFVERQFGVSVGADELVPQNFKTIESISSFIREKKGK